MLCRLLVGCVNGCLGVFRLLLACLCCCQGVLLVARCSRQSEVSRLLCCGL